MYIRDLIKLIHNIFDEKMYTNKEIKNLNLKRKIIITFLGILLFLDYIHDMIKLKSKFTINIKLVKIG